MITSFIRHSADMRAKWSPFSSLPGILLAPLFSTKIYMYVWPDFSRFVCERPRFSDTLVYAYIFSPRDF